MIKKGPKRRVERWIESTRRLQADFLCGSPRGFVPVLAGYRSELAGIYKPSIIDHIGLFRRSTHLPLLLQMSFPRQLACRHLWYSPAAWPYRAGISARLGFSQTRRHMHLYLVHLPRVHTAFLEFKEPPRWRSRINEGCYVCDYLHHSWIHCLF